MITRSYSHVVESSLEVAFAENKDLAIQAIESLSARWDTLSARWRRQLPGLGLDTRELRLLQGLDVNLVTRCLRRATFRSFHRKVSRLGQQLARQEMRIGPILTAFHLLLEVLLADLARASTERALAASRLAGMASVIAIAGYTRRFAVKQHALQEGLHEAERRLHGASAYVTNVYEQERRRLSHDLHDDIGHQLLVLKLYLDVIAANAEKGKTSRLRPRLEEALQLVSGVIESVRRLAQDLGPAIFDELGFEAALKFYARQFSTRTGTRVQIQVGRLPQTIPMSHQVALYRLMQGALSNVVKHAKAGRVKMSLRSAKGPALAMIIEDDGVGFDVAAALPRSFGLTAMRERVEVLGGTFHIDSARGGEMSARHGTRVEIELPLPKAGPR